MGHFVDCLKEGKSPAVCPPPESALAVIFPVVVDGYGCVRANTNRYSTPPVPAPIMATSQRNSRGAAVKAAAVISRKVRRWCII